MRENILFAASDLFLNYGFKSVTMDDIANSIGISKKTIYQHFDNKTKLVEATTMYLFTIISEGIDHICALEKNPLEEVFEIKRFVMHRLKDEKSSPQYQLQKYYPSIYNSIKDKQFEVMKSCVIQNLQRGMEQGLYRDSLNPEIIARIYFNSILAIKDKDLFPAAMFTIPQLMEHYLEYHLRGICTAKGLDHLDTLLTSNQSNIQI